MEEEFCRTDDKALSGEVPTKNIQRRLRGVWNTRYKKKQKKKEKEDKKCTKGEMRKLVSFEALLRFMRNTRPRIEKFFFHLCRKKAPSINKIFSPAAEEESLEENSRAAVCVCLLKKETGTRGGLL